MKKCDYYSQLIWLDIYDDIGDEQKKELEGHLKRCAECRMDLEEARQIKKLLNQKMQLKVTEKNLTENRAELHERLLLLTQPKVRSMWFEYIKKIVTLDFSPMLRFSTALALLILGVLVGKYILASNQKAQFEQQFLLSGLKSGNFAGVESIDYNPTTQQVSMRVNTMNRLNIQGELNKPEIQQILAQTLMVEERPNILLKTVGALTNTKNFEQNVLTALIDVLENDENVGVRLKTIKLLNTMPINDSVKDIMIRVLVKVLLKEKNSAIRIEAINGLSKIKDESVNPIFFNAAENDSNEYVRYRAAHSLQRLKNPDFNQ